MILIDKIENAQKDGDIYNYINENFENTQKAVQVVNAQKNNLKQLLEKIADIKIEKIKPEKTDDLFAIIEETRNLLNRLNDDLKNMEDLVNNQKSVLTKLEIATESQKESLNRDIDYILKISIHRQIVNQNTNLSYQDLNEKIYAYLFDLANNFEENEVDDNIYEQEEEVSETIEEEIIEQNSEVVEEKILEEADKNEEHENFEEKIENLDEKTEELSESKEITVGNKFEEESKDNRILKISEKENKVFLPYEYVDLEYYFQQHRDKYNSIQDVIDKEFTVSLNKYKNSAFARFKEAYHLMREKEKSSFSEALDLGLEVFFYNNLNPAIITACKDLSELDDYLNCLKDNKLEEFKGFKIEYDITPQIKF